MSGRVSAAVAQVTARCATQFVNIIGGTILHSDIFTVLATAWKRAKANLNSTEKKIKHCQQRIKQIENCLTKDY